MPPQQVIESRAYFRREVQMRRTALVTCLFVVAATMLAQQPDARPTPLVGMQPTAIPELLEIWRIDLIPSGSAFSLKKPVLDGDAYVYKAWPEREMARVRKDKVRQITRRTKDLKQEAVYQIDLVPSGRMVARDNPTLKNGSYTFHTWLNNEFMSLRKTDVLRITRLTGIYAFKAQEEVKGAQLLDTNLAMEGGGTMTIISGPPPEPVNPASAPAAASDPNAQGNWYYDGVPGVTDGYAPPNAVVAQPGDPPQAAPTQPPN